MLPSIGVTLFHFKQRTRRCQILFAFQPIIPMSRLALSQWHEPEFLADWTINWIYRSSHSEKESSSPAMRSSSSIKTCSYHRWQVIISLYRSFFAQIQVTPFSWRLLNRCKYTPGELKNSMYRVPAVLIRVKPSPRMFI